jgi:hypothetical protein
MDVFIKKRGGPVVAEGVIVPGFNSKDESLRCRDGIYRKVYVTEVYGMYLVQKHVQRLYCLFTRQLIPSSNFYVFL